MKSRCFFKIVRLRRTWISKFDIRNVGRTSTKCVSIVRVDSVTACVFEFKPLVHKCPIQSVNNHRGPADNDVSMFSLVAPGRRYVFGRHGKPERKLTTTYVLCSQWTASWWSSGRARGRRTAATTTARAPSTRPRTYASNTAARATRTCATAPRTSASPRSSPPSWLSRPNSARTCSENVARRGHDDERNEKNETITSPPSLTVCTCSCIRFYISGTYSILFHHTVNRGGSETHNIQGVCTVVCRRSDRRRFGTDTI